MSLLPDSILQSVPLLWEFELSEWWGATWTGEHTCQNKVPVFRMTGFYGTFENWFETLWKVWALIRAESWSSYSLDHPILKDKDICSEISVHVLPPICQIKEILSESHTKPDFLNPDFRRLLDTLMNPASESEMQMNTAEGELAGAKCLHSTRHHYPLTFKCQIMSAVIWQQMIFNLNDNLNSLNSPEPGDSGSLLLI